MAGCRRERNVKAVSVAAAGCAQYQFGGEDFGVGFLSGLRGQEGVQGALRQVL